MEVAMKILNFGSLNYDSTYQVDHMTMPGETQTAFQMETFCGGKGLNQSIALAKAGAKVHLAGAIGKDGQLLLDTCIEHGVDTSYIRTTSEKSGHTIIQIDRNAQNSILLYAGANRAQQKSHIDEVLSDFEAGDIILLQNEINCLDYIIEETYKKGMFIVLNPSPFDSHLKACDLAKVSLFLLNEIEGEQITGEKESEKILDAMREKYPDAKVVLTLGKQGSIYQDEKDRISQNSFAVQAVDTTAAGDTFTGYLVTGLVKNMAIKEVLMMCSKAAAIAVSRKGAVASIPSMDEVESWH